MTTSQAIQPKFQKRQYWVTDVALTNWKEKVKNFPPMDNERMATVIDEMVVKAIELEKFETIQDDDGPARLVHIGEGNDRYFALVKKSINKTTGEFAVVTIMTAAQVERKRISQWSRLDDSVSKTPERKSDPKMVGAPHRGSLLVTYIHKRLANVLHTSAHREYEEYDTEEAVEKRLSELTSVIITGTLRVYRELSYQAVTRFELIDR